MATKPRNTKPVAAPAATETPAASVETTETPAAAKENAAAPALIAALHKSANVLTQAETAAAKAVTTVWTEQLPRTLDAWQSYGLALKPILDAHPTLTWADTSGSKLAKAIENGLIPAADRDGLPLGATALTKALTIGRHDTAARRSLFLKSGNLPNSDEYVVYLTLCATGAGGSNRSTVDVRASLKNAADWDETANDGKGAAKPGALIGKIVRGAKPAAGAGGHAKAAVPSAIAKVLSVRDKRDKLAAVPVVATLNIPADKWDAFVAQVVAQYLLQHVETPAAGETIAIAVA